MRATTDSISARLLRTGLAVLFAIAALSVLSTRAHAANPDQIIISAPVVKIISHDYATRAPIEDVTVTARVRTDPATLTTNSGVTLLKDSVLEAARRACYKADPLDEDDGTCVREALKNAKPQMDAAIARARRSNAMNG